MALKLVFLWRTSRPNGIFNFFKTMPLMRLLLPPLTTHSLNSNLSIFSILLRFDISACPKPRVVSKKHTYTHLLFFTRLRKKRKEKKNESIKTNRPQISAFSVACSYQALRTRVVEERSLASRQQSNKTITQFKFRLDKTTFVYPRTAVKNTV